MLVHSDGKRKVFCASCNGEYWPLRWTMGVNTVDNMAEWMAMCPDCKNSRQLISEADTLVEEALQEVYKKYG